MCNIEQWLKAQTLHLGILGSAGEEPTCNVGDLGSVPRSGRCPGGGHGNPLQYSCLENPMDRGGWRATVHGVTRAGYDLATKPPVCHLLAAGSWASQLTSVCFSVLCKISHITRTTSWGRWEDGTPSEEWGLAHREAPGCSVKWERQGRDDDAGSRMVQGSAQASEGFSEHRVKRETCHIHG